MPTTAPTYYDRLLEETAFCPASPLGEKDADGVARQSAARRLSELMESHPSFCFLRLGDMDLAYLLAEQDGQLNNMPCGDGAVTGTQAQGNPGIGANYAARFRRAFELADYVDFHERLWPMELWLPRLELQRSATLHQNPDRETSYLLLTWLEKEFKQFCRGKHIGLAGAEAGLLELLSLTPEFQQVAADYWPTDAEIFFHQVREDGRNLDANLDLVKDDLKSFVQANRLDVLFLSLGGGAKILCYELARELNLRCFDFGAALRALTYSACDGNRAARSTHSPFLFRLPFGVYMEAAEEAFPRLKPEELLAKAHAQLLLEVQRKEIGWTYPSFEYDFSEENRKAFRAAFQHYQARYRRLFRHSPPAIKERKDFLHFTGEHRLTMEGRAFYGWLKLKAGAKNMLAKSALREVCGRISTASVASVVSAVSLLRTLRSLPLAVLTRKQNEECC